MSTTAVNTKSVDSSSGEYDSISADRQSLRTGWLPFALIVAGHAPLVAWHFSQLLDKPHFQFVALLPVAGVLLWLHLSGHTPKSNSKRENSYGSGLLTAFMVAISIACSGFATVIWSPWLGMVGLLCSIITWAYWSGGRDRLVSIFPYWLLACTAVPPPLGWDENLTIWLRGFTTIATGHLLDQFDLLHYTYGNIIEVPGKTLFVADACSGIHSLFVMFAAAIFLALWNRRNWLHTVFLVVFSFFLVMIENVARLTTVAVAWKFGVDLSIGRPHSLLGFFLFVFSVLMLLSTDQLIRFFLPSGLSFATVIKDLKLRTGIGLKKKSSVSRKYQAEPVPGLIVFCAILPVLGLMQLATKPVGLPVPSTLTQPELDFPQFNESTMPQTLAGFERSNYKFIERVEGDPLGKNSHVWEYKRGSLLVQLSLDYPYPNPHDLCECYFNTGWTIENRKTKEFVGREELYQEAGIARPLHGNATLMFCQRNYEGKNVALGSADQKIGLSGSTSEMISSFAARLKSGVGLASSPEKQAQLPEGPWYQIHLLAKHSRESTDFEKQLLRQLFTAADTVLQNRTASARKKEAS